MPAKETASVRPIRILVDLSHAAGGWVGVAQDIRLVFDMLARLEGVEASGLLMTLERHDLPRLKPRATDRLTYAAGVLHWMAGGASLATRQWEGFTLPAWFAPRRWLASVLRRLDIRATLRTDYHLIAVSREVTSNAIWRVLLGKTLPPQRRAALLRLPYWVTDLSVARIVDRTMMFPFLKAKRLHAEGFDCVLFGMQRPVRLPRGVQPLVRYHDAIPVTDVDTVQSWRDALTHQRLVAKCDSQALFVCNSPQSERDLLAIDPSRAGHTVVIPCALAPLAEREADVTFASIVAARQTARALGRSTAAVPGVRADEVPPYVLSVSTLEPRKNFVGLIRAWERVLARGATHLRLVIVANRGWMEADILAAMRPHVQAGRILHLEALPPEELQALSRQALCFAFPSFVEGFGYPPLEALQAGTPVLVSDLPVFHWMFGDAALYVDPYDVDDIADGIEMLAVQAGRLALRADLLSRREAALARFRPETIAAQWGALLDTMRAPRDP